MKFNTFLLIIFLSVFYVKPVNAQSYNDVKRKLANIKNYRSVKLDNGLTVICLNNPQSNNFVIRMHTELPKYVAKKYQSPLLIDAELRKSSEVNIPEHWKKSQLQSLNIKVSRDDKGIYAFCPTDNLEQAVNLFADILKNPKIHSSEIQQAKKKILARVNDTETKNDQKTDEITKSIIYGKEYLKLNKIDKKNIKKLNLTEYKRFYKDFYRPNNTYLLIMGNISMEMCKSLVNKALSDLQSKDIPKLDYKLLPIKEPKIVFFDTLPSGKTNIKILFPFALYPFTFNSEKTELLSVLFQDLLGEKLIKKSRLANKIEAKFESDKITGNYQLNVSLNRNSINKVIEEIISTISKLIKADYPNEKLTKAKQKIIKDFTKQDVDDKFISKLIMISETGNLPKEYYANFIDDIKNTGKKNMRIFAAKYLNYKTSIFQIHGDWYRSLNDFIKLSKNFRIELYKLNGELKKFIPKGFNGFSVIENYINAIGGRENIKKFTNVSIEYGMTYSFDSSDEMIVEGKFLHKDESKFVSTANIIVPANSDTIFLSHKVYNNNKGLDSTMSGKKILSGTALELLKYRSPLVPEMYYKDWGYDVKLTKARKTGTTYVWVVEMKTPANQFIIDSYDVDEAIRVKRIVRDNTYFGNRSITYSKYIKCEKQALTLPHFKKIQSGSTTIKMLIENIDFETKLAVDLFLIN